MSNLNTQLSTVISDIGDEFTTVGEFIGDLTQLDTTIKRSLVAAINDVRLDRSGTFAEVRENFTSIRNTSIINTAAKKSLADGHRSVYIPEGTYNVISSALVVSAYDVAYYGPGRVRGPYHRRFTSPTQSGGDSGIHDTLRAERSLRRFLSKPNPKVVITGDSLTTLTNIGSDFKSETLDPYIREFLNKTYPEKKIDFVNFGSGGSQWRDLNTADEIGNIGKLNSFRANQRTITSASGRKAQLDTTSSIQKGHYNFGNFFVNDVDRAEVVSVSSNAVIFDTSISGTVTSTSTVFYRSWVSGLALQEPDTIFILFGMNDEARLIPENMIEALKKLQNLDPKPDIVPMINFTESTFRTQVTAASLEQSAKRRDSNAAFQRNLLDFWETGYIDIGRNFHIVRDGYDPLTVFYDQSDYVTSTANLPLNYELGGYGHYWKLEFNSSIDLITDGIRVQVGGEEDNYIVLKNTSGGELLLEHYHISISGGDLKQVFVHTDENFTMPTTSGSEFEFYVKPGRIQIAINNTSTMDIDFPIITRGAELPGKVEMLNGTSANVSFTYCPGFPKALAQTAYDTFVYSSLAGGNAQNHPSPQAHARILPPVFSAQNWKPNLGDPKITRCEEFLKGGRGLALDFTTGYYVAKNGTHTETVIGKIEEIVSVLNGQGISYVRGVDNEILYTEVSVSNRLEFDLGDFDLNFQFGSMYAEMRCEEASAGTSTAGVHICQDNNRFDGVRFKFDGDGSPLVRSTHSSAVFLSVNPGGGIRQRWNRGAISMDFNNVQTAFNGHDVFYDSTVTLPGSITKVFIGGDGNDSGGAETATQYRFVGILDTTSAGTLPDTLLRGIGVSRLTGWSPSKAVEDFNFNETLYNRITSVAQTVSAGGFNGNLTTKLSVDSSAFIGGRLEVQGSIEIGGAILADTSVTFRQPFTVSISASESILATFRAPTNNNYFVVQTDNIVNNFNGVNGLRFAALMSVSGEAQNVGTIRPQISKATSVSLTARYLFFAPSQGVDTAIGTWGGDGLRVGAPLRNPAQNGGLAVENFARFNLTILADYAVELREQDLQVRFPFDFESTSTVGPFVCSAPETASLEFSFANVSYNDTNVFVGGLRQRASVDYILSASTSAVNITFNTVAVSGADIFVEIFANGV